MLESPSSEEKSTPDAGVHQKKSIERSAEKKSTRDSGIQNKSTEKSAEKKAAKKASVTMFHFWSLSLDVNVMLWYRKLFVANSCLLSGISLRG